MHINRTYRLFCIFLFILALSSPRVSQAVPSPDLLMGIGTSLAQWISIGLVFVLGVFATMRRHLQTLFAHSKKHLMILIIGVPVALIVLVSLCALGYQEYRAESLVVQLRQQDMLFPTEGSESDKLVFGSEQVGVNGNEKFTSKIGVISDPGVELIERYYEHIAHGRLGEAFELSHHKVSREKFDQWYGSVSSISLDKLTVVDEGMYSLELVLCEVHQLCDRYGVLMTLNKRDGIYTGINTSQVRSLKLDEEKQKRIQESDVVIANAELQGLLDSGQIADMVVLDAREDVEYENGRFPNSMHIRIADLKAGKWIDLDAEKTVIVLCWSGIRGKEVAEFLRSKEIDARYVDDGAQGWAESGGLWDGRISIKQTYSDRQYSRLLSCDEMRHEMKRGTFVVDSREPGRYEHFHILESVSIPMLYTPSSGLENAFAEVPQGASVVTVCDGYVNCFDARVTGIELEKRGHAFLGRFTGLSCFH